MFKTLHYHFTPNSNLKFCGLIHRLLLQIKEDVKTKKKGTKLKLARAFSDCVTICQSVKFKGFDFAVNNCKYHQCIVFLTSVACFCVPHVWCPCDYRRI